MSVEHKLNLYDLQHRGPHSSHVSISFMSVPRLLVTCRFVLTYVSSKCFDSPSIMVFADVYVTCLYTFNMGFRLDHHCASLCRVLTTKLDILTSKFIGFDKCVDHFVPAHVIHIGRLEITKSRGTSILKSLKYSAIWRLRRHEIILFI